MDVETEAGRTPSSFISSQVKPTVDGRLSQRQDFVNVLVVDEKGEALIFEGRNRGSNVISWRLVSERIAENADPLSAVQDALLQQTGLRCEEWRYMGSYTVSSDYPSGAGHFFFARCIQPQFPSGRCAGRSKWVTLKDLRYALLDGRISAISHAMTVSIALLTIIQ